MRDGGPRPTPNAASRFGQEGVSGAPPTTGGLVGGVKTRESGGCDNPDEATCEKRCEGSDSAFPS